MFKEGTSVSTWQRKREGRVWKKMSHINTTALRNATAGGNQVAIYRAAWS